VTLLWLVVWFIADQVGGRESLLFNPGNAWAATLLLAIALDLGGSHARAGSGRDRSKQAGR
jgi:hypothetical protein